MATVAPPAGAFARRHSLIGGTDVSGRGGVRSVVSPADGQAFAEVSLLDLGQVNDALDSARQAQPAWAALGYAGRSRHLLALRQALLEHVQEITTLIAREQGKPRAEALVADIFPSLETLKHLAYHAGELLADQPLEPDVVLFAHKQCRLRFSPLGVVLAITPWNYPFSLPLMTAAAALAAGNTVILKPAPATTLVGLELGRLALEAGLPPGVLNVLAIDDALAPALVEDPRLAKIVFTGSVATGRRIMAAAAKHLTPVVLELGGKDAALVAADADLERTAAGLVWGAFLNAGQTCASIERVYVEESIADRLIERVLKETARLRVGDPLAAEIDMGPLTLERQRELVERHVQDAVARGAELLAGGRRKPGPGYFFEPTVLTRVDHSMLAMCDETFGPLLPIQRVRSIDEAVRLANDSPYGLTASVWTRDVALARRVSGELRAGVVTINDHTSTFGEPTAPWGGLKHSGIGRAHGALGLHELVHATYVAEDFSRGRALWWYPYGEAFRQTMLQALRAVHERRLHRKLGQQLRLVASRRFLQRASLVDVLLHADKLY